jgi:hypothetical protein
MLGLLLQLLLLHRAVADLRQARSLESELQKARQAKPYDEALVQRLLLKIKLLTDEQVRGTASHTMHVGQHGWMPDCTL